MAHSGAGDLLGHAALPTGAVPDDEHLGSCVPRVPGAAPGPRIVMVSTSAVFADQNLVPTFWNQPAVNLDSGLQGHLYTRAGDVFVLRLPVTDAAGRPCDDTRAVAELLATLNVNAALWARYTGLRLVTSADRVVIAADRPPQADTRLPPTVCWRVGGLQSAAAQEFRSGRADYLAGVLDHAALRRLGVSSQCHQDLLERAEATTVLMDKNAALRLLPQAGVDCADTYTFTAASWTAATAGARTLSLPGTQRYVFKPAGGAAGIGVFGAAAPGKSLAEVIRHVNALAACGILPNRFQLQRFVPGPTVGVCAVLGPDSARVLEVHRQRFDLTGEFAGACWSRPIVAEHSPTAGHIAAGLGRLPGLPVRGMVCWDMIDGKVIEVNPRLTACAPIAHLLSRAGQIGAHLGPRFRMNRIDLNVAVPVPAPWLTDGRLRSLIDILWQSFGVLALPQGLNPFGPGRFAFVNDDESGSAQQYFLAALSAPADVVTVASGQ